MTHRIICGDSLHVLPTLDAESVDAIVCDPPYGLSFMGKEWDHGVPGEAFWREALRVAKPGAHLLAFGGSRTYHRLAVAIEDAGWEVRDCLSWLYGSGFPKSHNLDGDWQGWGTALKPAWEPIIVARKPLVGNVAANVAQYGTGALNVDATRIGTDGGTTRSEQAPYPKKHDGTEDRSGSWARTGHKIEPLAAGRWPANVVLDEDAAAMLDAQTGTLTSGGYPPEGGMRSQVSAYGKPTARGVQVFGANSGGASRFFFVAKDGERFTDAERECAIQRCVDIVKFGQRDEQVWTRDLAILLDMVGANNVPDSLERFLYTAKASRREREAGLEGMPTKSMRDGAANHTPRSLQVFEQHGKLGSPAANHHPTVKPIALMRWLCRLVTPPNGLVLDPFTGSGSTGCAAVLEGFRFVGIEREPEYAAIAEKRIAHWAGQVETPEPSLFDG